MRLFGSPIIAPSGDGRLEVFVLGFDQNLWHIWQTQWSNGWSGWASHGGNFGSSLFAPPFIGRSGDGRLELFVCAGQLQHIWQTKWSNGWSNWASHGAPPPGPFPGAGYLMPGDLALDATGKGHLFVSNGGLWRLYQTAWSNGWSNWQAHGSPPAELIVGPPAIGQNADGRLEVFVVGASGALWHQWETAIGGAWSAWNSMGTGGVNFDDRPGVMASADGRLELFVRAVDGTLWHRWQTKASNGWSGWYSHGTPVPGVGLLDHPALGRSADGRLELFIVGIDGNLWHKWQTAASNGWSAWTSHGSSGGGFFTAAELAPSGDGRLELFVVGRDGSLHHIWQTKASNGWSAWVSHGQPP